MSESPPSLSTIYALSSGWGRAGVAVIRVSGDWAIEEGDWTWTMPTTQGEVRDHGKYLETWRRTETSWEVVQNIWNSDITPPVPVAK